MPIRNGTTMNTMIDSMTLMCIRYANDTMTDIDAMIRFSGP